MIKTISLWVKNDSKWNILLFIFALWILYVFSVSKDATNPMNNGYGFLIFSLFAITWINILPLCTPTKNKSMIQILEETNNIPITLLMLFLFKTFILYIVLLFIWILHSIFNHTPVMILPASLMYWLSSSLSILLYSFCLFLRFSKSEYWRRQAYFSAIILFTFTPFITRYTRFNYQVFSDFFKEYTIWILLLFFLFYIIGYLWIKRIIRKYFKEL
mgnify:FL=1